MRYGGISAVGMVAALSSARAAAETFDQQVENLVRPLSDAISAVVFFEINLFGQPFPLIVLWLAVAALFFTLYMGFINIRGFGLALRHVRGHFHNPQARGEISHFQAVATAVSGTVGIGNIGGVAVAIVIGGPGAAFWLIVAGFLSMSTKLVECTLGVKYRRYNPDGSVSGGPMYYLEHFLKVRGAPRWGRLLGGFYALALVIGCFGIGNMFQSNQAYVQFVIITGGEDSFFAGRGWLFGIMIAIAVGFVIIGGIKSIARVAAHIVPFMAILYVVSALVIIIMSAEHIPGTIKLIMDNAFSAQSATGARSAPLSWAFSAPCFPMRRVSAPLRLPTPRYRPTTRHPRGWFRCWSPLSIPSWCVP